MTGLGGGSARPYRAGAQTHRSAGDGVLVVDVDDRVGPFTIAGPGLLCLVCDEPLERGDVAVFARTVVAVGPADGVAHEGCCGYCGEVAGVRLVALGDLVGYLDWDLRCDRFPRCLPGDRAAEHVGRWRAPCGCAAVKLYCGSCVDDAKVCQARGDRSRCPGHGTWYALADVLTLEPLGGAR